MLSSSILNSITFKKLASYPAEFPNMWNTLHIDRKQTNSLIRPYYQKFTKDHIVYLQFESDTDAPITLISRYGRTQIESMTISWNTLIPGTGSHYGTDDNRYYTNFVVTLDSPYYGKIASFTVTQGTDVLTSEPVSISDLTEQINKGLIKYVKYTNLDRIESDLDNRFIDWSALDSAGKYMDFFIEALDADLNDSDKSEVLEGSQSLTILSASYFTGKTLKTGPVPDYMIAKLGMVSNLDVFMVNGIQYIKKGEIEAERFGGSTFYQASLKITQKIAIGINVDNIGSKLSKPIIPDSTTKMYIGTVTTYFNPTESEVKAMTELDAVKANIEWTFTPAVGQRNCIAYPASFGDLVSVYFFETFELMSGFQKTTANFTFGTNTVLMNIYTFSSPLTFTDGVEKTINYVMISGLLDVSVGDSFAGGIIGYIFEPGDVGYIAGQTHGIVVAPTDNASAKWSNSYLGLTGSLSTAIGSGRQNTLNIIASFGGEIIPSAAQSARSVGIGNYSDWFLPSSEELQKIYANKTIIGGFDNVMYWTSTEYDSDNAYYITAGGLNYTNKLTAGGGVRAVRYF